MKILLINNQENKNREFITSRPAYRESKGSL